MYLLYTAAGFAAISLLIVFVGWCLDKDVEARGWASPFMSLTCGITVGMAICGLTGHLFIFDDKEVSRMEKPTQNCYTIDGKTYCNDFHYENNILKIDKNGPNTIIMFK